ncbi:MAG: ATP-dependent helicase [Burkholderiales bacterium]|nr:ATP-dependent helicase [Burkholderiales bacterium]
MRTALAGVGFRWLVSQVDAAEAVLRGGEPPAGFFASGPRERWRDVLAALQSLGAAKGGGDAGTDAARLVWSIELGKRGTVDAIEPLEQKRGPRGYGKAKSVSLGHIAGNERLPPWDAKVARAIRKDRYSPRHGVLDRAAAIIALIGHPAVVLADAPEQFVDVVEGSPELEVVREKDSYRMRVTPPVHDEDAIDDDFDAGPGSDRERAALRTITVVRDSPKRLRVIRLTDAQRRAAQLVEGAFRVPTAAQQELQETLRALAAHFQVHDDHAQAAREVDADARLRAELSPVGEHLALRLVAAPLGAQGPRVAPGAGRARLMAAIAGEVVGARRDLAAERAHLDTVLDALPFLDEPDADGACEWVIADAEHALGAVERLPTLAAVAAVEWPKGKPVRVVTVDARRLGLVVKAERDWFRLGGRVAVDERTVLDFADVLAAAQARSRFVPMGEGVYVALTHSLKARLADLAAVAEADRDGLRVPRVAALWLDEALEGATLETDAAFRGAIERLRRAQDDAAPLPKSLQAELRPYQEDGYRWAMRLASAGLGGCLADDMGLGKTLQGLAVLLARADAGPALVVAPTSVCGNWLAEARRFAPTLNVAIYGEAERETAIASAGPRDVVVVSYTLLQQASERFAARRWHTVIADEAQAIKNAAAKRSQAVFDLDTDFRLALSGTPVENRLAELWSIMRFANPGLLGTIARFTERFAGPIERDRDREAQQRLRRLIGPFVLRRTKAQVLQELPPRTELSLAVAPAPAEAAYYEALRRQAVADADTALATQSAGQARFNILVQLTRLRRAACDPRLVSPDLGVAGAKVQAFADLAADIVANGHKALVFSQFVDFLTLLRQPLDAAGIAYQYLDGSTPAGERTRRVAAFQAGEGDLFLISLKAGGFGLNLTAADYVLITDPWWNPAAEDQAMGRAHRIGQGRPVTVYRLVTKGTVEERIVALHQDKRALADSILAEGDAALLPSADELIALIRGQREQGAA